MNTKSVSIFISFLLLNNFYIELQARNLQGGGRLARNLQGGGRLARSLKEDDLTITSVGLGSPTSASLPVLDLTLSVSKEILIVRNTTSEKVVLIDTEKQVILLLDGHSTAGVVINQKKNEGALIPDGVWNATDTTLTKFLKSIDNDLLSILDREECVEFSLPKVPSKINDEISSIVQDLVILLAPELQQRPELALELVLSIATSIEEFLKGLLDGLLENLGNQQIELAIDIVGVVNVLDALNVILNCVEISIKELNEKSCSVDIALIIGAQDGLTALRQTIRQLGETIDISGLSGILEDPEILTKLIALLGGNRNVGITGAFRLASAIIELANGNTSLDRVISILILVVARSSDEINDDLQYILQNELVNLLEIIDVIGATKTLEGLVEIVLNLLTGEFVVEGVNISDIISIIVTDVPQAEGNLLSIIVKILKALDPIVEKSKSIPELLLVLIIQLDSACGVNNLILLGLDLGTSGCACSLLETLSESASEWEKDLSKDLYSTCSNLPIIGNIIVALEVVISEDNLSLKELLEVSVSVESQIKGVLQLVVGVELDIEQKTLDQCEEVIETCNGVSTLVEIDVTVTITVTSD